MNILVTFDLPPELVGRIEAVSPTVHVRVLGLGERDAFIAREGRLPFPSEIQACTPAGDIEGALPEADVLFAYWGTALVGLQDLRERAPRLRWVQLTHVGAEQVAPSLLASDIIFTSAVGLASTPIAEMVLAYMLMFAKGWPRLWRDQRTRNYWRLTPGTLAGKTVGIVGMGSIGAEVARLVRPFGCRVVGTRRSLSERVRGEADGDEVVPASELHYLLAASDYVVICAPLTADTKGMIDGRALASMQAEAVLINIARGTRGRVGAGRGTAIAPDPGRSAGRVRARTAARQFPAVGPRQRNPDAAHLRGHGALLRDRDIHLLREPRALPGGRAATARRGCDARLLAAVWRAQSCSAPPPQWAPCRMRTRSALPSPMERSAAS